MFRIFISGNIFLFCEADEVDFIDKLLLELNLFALYRAAPGFANCNEQSNAGCSSFPPIQYEGHQNLLWPVSIIYMSRYLRKIRPNWYHDHKYSRSAIIKCAGSFQVSSDVLADF